MKGKFDTTIESQNKFAVAMIYVTEDDGGCLLSAETAQDLELVRFHLDALQEDKMRTNTSPDHVLKDLKDPQDPKITAILTKHQELFHGLGKMKNKEIELCVDRAIPPVAQQQRRIPFHLRDKVELELKRLEAQDIIEKVPANEHTDWVSPIVVVPKKEQAIRICVDMRAANTAIKRFRHPIPIVKDISLALNGAQYFTKQYIRDYATLTEPLRRLTHKDTQFVWEAAQEEAYQTLKTALLSSPVMSYFDITKETTILVDASPVGMSAILSQRKHGSSNSQIIAYASRSLSQTEQRYSLNGEGSACDCLGHRTFPSLHIWSSICVVYRSQTT